MNRLAVGEVPAAVALLYKESETSAHSPTVVSNTQRMAAAGGSREVGSTEKGESEERKQGSVDRKRRNIPMYRIIFINISNRLRETDHTTLPVISTVLQTLNPQFNKRFGTIEKNAR
ncbi:unnamed protein product [Arctia plantaginis]|uniref:Uncharacterized protein n=1 Tax=Arctia plantaginis TaxID=874455 RepID=A0A8S0ZJT4_ARCPL|nr:unnamed protein product [Arctia plantaginis]